MAAPVKHLDGLGMDKKVNETPKKRKKSSSMGGECKKKPKLKKVQFTEIEFKFMLKDATTTFPALEKFMEQAKKFPEETDFDIVSNYCRSSEEFTEIFKLLEGEKRKKTELCTIFEVLEHTLMRIASGLEKHASTAQHICRRLSSTHLGVIMSMFEQGSKSGHLKTTLKLLTAMVMQSDATAKDLVVQFNFANRHLATLWSWRSPSDQQDVRTCLLLFALSFLYSGDDLTIKQLVNAKGFLNAMFPGMIKDRARNIQMILSTLLDKVVRNASLRKTDRIKLFGTNSISSIAQLYNWKHFVSWKDEKDKKKHHETEQAGVEEGGEEETEEQRDVHAAVHQFLLELCCSLTHGISFHDKSYATSGKNINPVLHHMLSGFHQPFLHSLQPELIIRVLVVCPDLLHWYLPALKGSLAPRPNSPTWIKCIDFLYKVFEAQPELSPIFKGSNAASPSLLVAMVMNTIVPHKDLWSCITEAVKSDDRLVQYKGLRFAALITSRLHHNLQYYVEQRHCDASSDLFCIRLRGNLRKILPSWFMIKTIWNKLTGQEDEKLETKPPEVEQNSELPRIDDTAMLKAILEYLCAYQSVIPVASQPQPLQYSAVLEGVQGVTLRMRDDPAAASELTMYLLKLLAESEDKFVNWGKKESGNKSFLRLLLEMVTIHTEDELIKVNCRRLVSKMLCRTGLFEGNEEELDIWLLVLSNINPQHSPHVISFLEKIFFKLLKDPYTCTEQIIQYSSDASSLEANQHDDTTSVATSSDHLVDMILSMDAVSLEEEAAEKSATENEEPFTQRFPFSGLLPCACSFLAGSNSFTLESCENIPASPEVVTAEVRHFLFTVVCQMLRTQTDPLALCLLLLKHQEIFLNILILPKIKHFLPQKLRKEMKTPKKPKKKSTENSDTKLSSELVNQLELLFESEYDFAEDCDNKREELLTMIGLVTLEECTGLVKQVLVYLRTEAIVSRRVSVDSLNFYMDCLDRIVEKLAKAVPQIEPGDDTTFGAERKTETCDTSECDDSNSKETGESETEEGTGDAESIQAGTPDVAESRHGFQLSVLRAEVTSARSVLLQVLRLILLHPTLQSVFLWHEDLAEETSAKWKKRMRKISSVISGRMSDLVKSIESCEVRKTREFARLVHSYVFRLESMLAERPESADGVSVVSVMSGFIVFLGSKTLVKCLEVVAHKSIEDLIDSEAETLKSDRHMLVQIAHLILKNSRENFSRVTITTETLHRLLELNLKMDLYLELIRSIYEEHPCYSNQMTEKLFGQYMSSRGHRSVVTLWLTQSEQCRAWFGQWLGAASDEEVRSKETIPLVLVYIKLQRGRGMEFHALATRLYEHLLACTVIKPARGMDEITRQAQRDILHIFIDHVDDKGEALITKKQLKVSLNKLLSTEANTCEDHVTRVQVMRKMRRQLLPSDAHGNTDGEDVTRACFKNALGCLAAALRDSSSACQQSQNSYLDWLLEICEDIRDNRMGPRNKYVKEVVGCFHGGILSNGDFVEAALNCQTSAKCLTLLRHFVELCVRRADRNIGDSGSLSDDKNTKSGDGDVKRSRDVTRASTDSSTSDDDSSPSESDDTSDDGMDTNDDKGDTEMANGDKHGEADSGEFLKPLFQNLLTHSRFSDVIQDTKNSEEKGAMLDLMLAIAVRCGAVCETAQLAALLGAYAATLHPHDRTILALLRLYEQNGCLLSDYRPFLWGARAVEHYSAEHSLGASLRRQPTVEQVLDQLSSTALWTSALKFPLTTRLQEEVSTGHGEKGEKEELWECYDPRFILPLFNYLLSSENFVNCKKFAEDRCLAYTLSALSSHDADMRALAYGVLARFYYHTEGLRFVEKRQILYILDLLRGSLGRENEKLPCLLALFLAKCSALMLRPTDHMYSVLNLFLLCKPSLDLLNVPELYKLFNSSALEYKTERAWLLEMLIDGLRETGDFRICERRYTFKLILSFHDSALSDPSTQRQVLGVVARACQLKSIAFELSKVYDILAWFGGVIKSRGVEEESSGVIEALRHMWFAMLDGRDRDFGVRERRNPVLPLQFLAELYAVLRGLISSVRFASAADVLKLVSMFASMQNHSRQRFDHIAKSKPEDMNYQANLIGLRSDDVLLLLFHWSSMDAVVDECARFCATSQELLRVIGKLPRETTEKVKGRSRSADDLELKSAKVIGSERIDKESMRVPIVHQSLVKKLQSDSDLIQSVARLIHVVSSMPLEEFDSCAPSSLDITCVLLCLQWCAQLNLLVLKCDLDKQAARDWLDSQMHLLQFIKKFTALQNSAGTLQVGNVDVMLQVMLGACRSRAVHYTDLTLADGFYRVAQTIEELSNPL